MHDILAGETAIPCTLMTQVNSCGRALDQSSEHANLRKGHGLDLPLWLASDVAARNMVTIRSVLAVVLHVLYCVLLQCSVYRSMFYKA